MKKNNKGITLVEILVSFLLVALTLVAGTAFFIKAFKYSYLYSDVVFNIDTGANIFEKQKRNAMAAIIPSGSTPAALPAGTPAKDFNQRNLGTGYNIPNSGGNVTFSFDNTPVSAVGTGTGYNVDPANVNSLTVTPTLLEVNYKAQVSPTGKPGYDIRFKSHYAYGMFRDVP